MIFDTHAHYTDEKFGEERGEILSALPAEGIVAVFVPGTTAEDTGAAVGLAAAYPYVWAGAGIHPHSADTATPEALGAIESFLSRARENRIIAVGECGLDYHYDFSPRKAQQDCFAAHIELAVKYGLPIAVHDREAHADTLGLLRARPGARGVYHCWSGSAEMVPVVVKMGFYVSFAGSVTFKNAHRLREAARVVPPDRLLVETDAPYMAPEPFRGRRNDSRLIKYIIDALAEVRGISLGELEELTRTNAKELFGV